MSKHDCTACGQDLRLPPINFQRMEWILRLFAKIADADKAWVVSRLSADLAKPKPKVKRKYAGGPVTKSDSYWVVRHYVGSGGECVEVQPYGRREWVYRFPKDRRWRVAKDKFEALLHAAWEMGKSMQAMNWTPKTKREPRKGFVALALERAGGDCDGS